MSRYREEDDYHDDYHDDRHHLSPAARLDPGYGYRERARSPEQRRSRRNLSPERARSRQSGSLERSRRSGSPERDDRDDHVSKAARPRRSPRPDRRTEDELRCAIDVLKSSTAWQVLSTCALLFASIFTIVHIAVTRNAMNDAEAGAGAGSAASDVLMSEPESELKEERDNAKLLYTLCAVALGCSSMPPLVKANRDYVVDEIPISDVQPSTRPLALTRGSHNLIWAWAIFFLALCFAVHAMIWGSGAPTSNEKLNMMICLFFLLSSIGWVAELRRDRIDVQLCDRSAARSNVQMVARLAEGSAFHIYSCIVNVVLSCLLTTILLLSSESPAWDNWVPPGLSLQFFLVLGEITLVVAICVLVNHTDKPLAARGCIVFAAVLMTFGVGAWFMADMDTVLGLGLYTGFLYICTSSCAFAKLLADLAKLDKALSERLKEPWGSVVPCSCCGQKQ